VGKDGLIESYIRVIGEGGQSERSGGGGLPFKSRQTEGLKKSEIRRKTLFYPIEREGGRDDGEHLYERRGGDGRTGARF